MSPTYPSKITNQSTLEVLKCHIITVPGSASLSIIPGSYLHTDGATKPNHNHTKIDWSSGAKHPSSDVSIPSNTYELNEPQGPQNPLQKSTR